MICIKGSLDVYELILDKFTFFILQIFFELFWYKKIIIFSVYFLKNQKHFNLFWIFCLFFCRIRCNLISVIIVFLFHYCSIQPLTFAYQIPSNTHAKYFDRPTFFVSFCAILFSTEEEWILSEDSYFCCSEFLKLPDWLL